MGKLGTIAEISVILTAPFAVVAALPQLGFEKAFPEFVKNPYVVLSAFVSFYALIVTLLVAVATFFGQLIVSAVMRFNGKMLDVTMLEKSKIETGGSIDIDGRLTGDLENGYITFVVETPFGTMEKIRLFYDEEKKVGRLNGNLIRKHFLIHWNIPANLVGSDEQYHVTVNLVDVYVLKLFRVFKWKHVGARWQTDIQINEPKKPNIEIQKLIRPHIDGLTVLNGNDLSKSGWICVKVYNDTERTHKDCFGKIKTDSGEFALYDYNNIVANHSNGKTNPFFTIDAHSPKILCANIQTKDMVITITIDVGKEEICKELTCFFDN